MTLHQRIGQGIDFHRLEEGRELWLGGVRISSSKGCVAHSDGDVLIHAVCDALLGAAGLNDIGTHFPDTSEEFRGIDSKILLKRTVQMVTGKGYRIANIDGTVCLEAPKLAPYITAMRTTMASVACHSQGYHHREDGLHRPRRGDSGIGCLPAYRHYPR